MKKTHIYAITVITVISFLMLWKFFFAIESSKSTIHSCIQDSSKKLKLKFITDSLVSFEVFFIRNAQRECVNPYFPSIHIKTAADHNAWLHIIYTDSEIKALQMFVDSENPLKENSIYPFYTFESDFYDAPFWTYSFFNKPLSFWKGHAFALDVDHQNKTVRCLGGIEWGFKLYFPRIRPAASDPRLLSQIDWDTAWQFVKEKLPGYTVLTVSTMFLLKT